MKNWTVRVYANSGDAIPIAKWKIENRSEHEAEREAIADVAREFPDAEDWSLTATS